MALVPFDQRDGWIWLDGEFVPWGDARIHVLTHGLHYGSCVFEGQRIYEGEVFKLRTHTDRLFRSAELLDMAIPFSRDEIDAACCESITRSGLDSAYMRPFVWRGSEQLSVAAQGARIRCAVAVWPWASYFDPEEKKRGIRLDHAIYRRPAPETAPYEAKAAGLYMIATLSKHAAEAKGYADALMLDYRGWVSEATGANVFFVRDGALHTPTPDCFLNGITRQTVIQLARDTGLEVIERHIKPEELGTFNECFLTGSAAEVTPVSEIAEHRYTPGNISLSLMDAYSRLVRRQAAPAV